MPAKAIPPARDRLQSKILVWIVAPVLCLLCVWTIATAYILSPYDPRHRYLLADITISLTFALLAWRLKAAAPAAAACGGAVCLLLTDRSLSLPPSALHSGLPPLMLLFVLTFFATRYGRAKKEARGLFEPRTGRRASQVIANLSVAAICAFLYGRWLTEFAFLAMIAALAEATADTVSSEVGQAVAGPAFLITTLRRVPPGTDGAISLAGTFAGLLGAAVVVYVGLPPQSFKLLVFGAIFTASIAGFLFDSLLGATLERRGYLGNDLVNFASTAFAAAALYPSATLAMSFLHF